MLFAISPDIFIKIIPLLTGVLEPARPIIRPVVLVVPVGFEGVDCAVVIAVETKFVPSERRIFPVVPAVAG